MNHHPNSDQADVHTAIEMIYRGIPLTENPVQDAAFYNQFFQELDIPPLTDVVEYSHDFNIPDEYKQIDVVEYVWTRTPEIPERQQRVQQELAIYETRNLYPVLQALIYMVDTMRKNRIVWGVGRGSSVASYVLFLIGVHKIDSVRFQLPIQEFFK